MKRIVLVNPSGPRNVGMILRTAANFGPCEVMLVAPTKPSLLIHPDFEQMSHGVENPRERCLVVETLEEALADCTRAVGFTARVRGKRLRADWRDVQDGLRELDADPAEHLALVFGNEETGLTIAHTDLCHELVHIPTSAEHTSLNLAMSVGVVLCALYVGAGRHKYEPGGHMLSGAGREFLKANLRYAFGEKVALTPSARRDIEASIDRIFSRVPLENRDARAWHLMARALGSKMSPQDFDLDPNPEKGMRRAEAMNRALRRESDPSDG